MLASYQIENTFHTTRLRTDGTPDRRYGTDGTATAPWFVENGSGVRLDGNNRIVVVDGTAVTRKRGNDLLGRPTARGRVDKTFGAAGEVPLAGRGNGSLVVYPDDTMLAEVTNVIQRFDANGLPLRGAAPRELRGVENVVGVTANGTTIGGDDDSFYSSAFKVVTLPPADRGTSGRLYLNGTNGDDRFRLRADDLFGFVDVDVNGRHYASFSDVRAGTDDNPFGVLADLGRGDDVYHDDYYTAALDASLPVNAARVTGGAGDDAIVTGNGRDQVFAGDGDDTVRTDAGDDRLTGGNTGRDFYDLGDGADRLSQTSGPVTVYGGAGRDKITADNAAADQYLDGGDGDDTLSTSGGRDRVSGGPGDDLIVTGEGDDTIVAGVGNDTVRAGGGRDRIYAGAEGGRVRTARNTIDAGTGRDRVWRESDRDVLSGAEAVLV